jgi:hypothetical protein
VSSGEEQGLRALPNAVDTAGAMVAGLVGMGADRGQQAVTEKGLATYYTDVGCAACRTTGTCKCCKNNVPTGPREEKCYKNVYVTEDITGVAAIKAKGATFACWDQLKVEALDPATGRKTGRAVTVTVVDTGRMPKAIVDLRKADLDQLTGDPKKGSARVEVTKLGSGWPSVSRICWASNTCKRRENAPAEECRS